MKQVFWLGAAVFCLLLFCACGSGSGAAPLPDASSKAASAKSALSVPPEETLNLVSGEAVRHSESGSAEYRLPAPRVDFYRRIFEAATEAQPADWYGLLDEALPFQNYAVELSGRTDGLQKLDDFFLNFYEGIPDTLYLLSPAGKGACVRKYSYDGEALVMQLVTSSTADYAMVYYFDTVQCIDDFYYCTKGGVTLAGENLIWTPDGENERSFPLSRYAEAYPRPERVGRAGSGLTG